MNYQARLGELKVPLGPKLAAYEPRAKSGLLLVFYKQNLIGTQAHPFVYLLSKTVFLTVNNCNMKLYVYKKFIYMCYFYNSNLYYTLFMNNQAFIYLS